MDLEAAVRAAAGGDLDALGRGIDAVRARAAGL